jgi:hypothetical protein
LSVEQASARYFAWIETGVLAMNVRSWLGDVGLAVLLALPTATLAAPTAYYASRPTVSAQHVQLTLADRATTQSRLGLPG